MNIKKYYLLSSIALGAVAVVTLFASTASAAVFPNDLTVGSKNASVTELQNYFSEDPLIYPEAISSGYFGDLTKSAVIRFQERFGINPTGYVGPITREKLNEIYSINPVGDVTAPTMSAISVSASRTSATLTWTTSEPANSRVMYSTYYPFSYLSAASQTSTSNGTTSANVVTLTGLTPNTTYYYICESVDPSWNITWTSVKTFYTTS